MFSSPGCQASAGCQPSPSSKSKWGWGLIFASFPQKLIYRIPCLDTPVFSSFYTDFLKQNTAHTAIPMITIVVKFASIQGSPITNFVFEDVFITIRNRNRFPFVPQFSEAFNVFLHGLLVHVVSIPPPTFMSRIYSLRKVLVFHLKSPVLIGFRFLLSLHSGSTHIQRPGGETFTYILVHRVLPFGLRHHKMGLDHRAAFF